MTWIFVHIVQNLAAPHTISWGEGGHVAYTHTHTHTMNNITAEPNSIQHTDQTFIYTHTTRLECTKHHKSFEFKSIRYSNIHS